MGDRMRLVVLPGNGVEVCPLAHGICSDKQVPRLVLPRFCWEEHHLVIGKFGVLLLDGNRHAKYHVERGGDVADLVVAQRGVV